MPKLPSSRWRSLGSIALLLGAAGFVAGSAWMSAEFIMDPRSVIWMNQFLPDQAKIPLMGLDDPKNMDEIEAELQKAGLFAGDPVRVRSTQGTTDLLMPVFRRSLKGETPRIIEVRVYRTVLNVTARKKEAFQFINQLDIRDLDEGFVTEPLARSGNPNGGGQRSLPFTNLQRLEEGAPANGVWLTLSGKLQQGEMSIAYGQMLFYSPITTLLNALVPWTSPDGSFPTWQKAAKNRPADLVVNQTVGLEPDFQVYQVRATRRSKTVPFQLQPISLKNPAVDHGAYADALFLARSGLWSSALEILQSVKQQLPDSDWTATARSQLELVARHAKITKTQADQPWANPSQEILADLLDGRWAKAAQRLQSSPTHEAEVFELLKLDSGRLQRRIKAALQLNPARSDVQIWAALRLATKEGKSSAIVWLNQQPQDSASLRSQTLKLIDQMDATELGQDSSTRSVELGGANSNVTLHESIH